MVFLMTLLLTFAQDPSQPSSRRRDEPERQVSATSVYSPNTEANELFLEAREFLSKSDPRTGGTLTNARQAIKLFESAVKKDPKFALAFVEMARARLRLGYSDPDELSIKELLPPAKAAVLKALALEKNLTDAHLLLASLYHNFDYDWAKAEREYKMVLKLAPNNAAAHTGYAAYLSSMGRFDEALREAKKAEELTPSLGTDLALARIYYSMRRFDVAADLL